MSDVSGIPYMGPMGQGNFFAPQFSNNPQLSAGQIQSAYMPEFYNNQNVVNNLYGGGANAGFGQLTNYYSALGANQLSGVGSTNPYGVFGEGGGGGGGASPYQTSSSVWDTGASPFQGGGGSSGFGGSIYDFGGGLGSLGASPYQTTPNVFDTGSRGLQYPGAGALDWGGLYQTAQQSGLSPGQLSGLGGLGGAPYTPQPNPSLDWGSLFGGGGARADPYPGMSMPGGLSSPMTAQQPAYDYGSLFKGGNAQADPYPGMAMPGGLSSPMTTQQPAYDYGSLFGQGAGGAGAPQSSPFDTGAAPITGAQDTGPTGGGAGIGGLDTGRAIGASYTQAAEPQRGMLQAPVTEAYSPYFNVTGGEGAGPRAAAGTGEAPTPGGGLTAADLSEQARAKLAELMTKPSELSPDEVFAGDKPVPTEGQPAVPPTEAAPAPTDPYAALPGAVPLPLARPAEAPTERIPLPAARPAEAPYQDPNAPRPPGAIPEFPAARPAPNGEEPEAFIVHHTSGGGTPESVVNFWKEQGRGLGSQYIMDRNGVVHDTAAEYGWTKTSHIRDADAVPVKGAGTSGLNNRNVVGMEIIARDDADVTPVQLASLKQFADTRYPNTPFYGHGEVNAHKEGTEGATGVDTILNARIGAGQGVFPSSSDFWDQAAGASAGRVPLPVARPAEAPATAPGPATSAEDWLGNAGRYAGNPFVSAAQSAELPGAQGPTMPTWQASIPPAQRNPELVTAIQTMADRFGIPAASVAGIPGLETGNTWDPLTNTKGNPNYGVAQLEPKDFQTGGGTLGGLTFEQYKRATPAQQIGAYSDYIASSPNAAYLDYASGDPALTMAILQAIQFSPQGTAWSDALLGGNTSMPTAANPNQQAKELRPTSVDAMRDAFARRIASWPQTQTLPGGR